MDFSRASLLVLGLLALSVNALDPVLSSAPDGEGETKTVPLNNDHLPVEMDTNHEQTAMDLPLEQGQFWCCYILSRTESDSPDKQ